MFQLFFKKSQITSQEWSRVYRKIESIVVSFPLRLVRIESYDGFTPKLDKEYFDLYVEKGKPDEHISFYGDQTSYTSGVTINFYKHWDKMLKYESKGNKYVEDKPVTWFPPEKYTDDGSLAEANGYALGRYGYIDTRGALYEYVLLSIGVVLENELPGKVFMIYQDVEVDTIQKIIEWLNFHFHSEFELPLYYNKLKLLNSFIAHFTCKKYAVARMENLFPKQFKHNIEFSIKYIDFQSALLFYSEVLASNYFNTFGFYDVLDGWVAATQNIESTLQLIAGSKRLLMDGDKKYKEKAEEYDLSVILKKFLNAFILWTPQQREDLEHFYTNKEALETGKEDLWGSIMRMAGHRVEICPIFTTHDELFEAFMYHDPKKGAEYLKIIDDWIIKNKDVYNELHNKMLEVKEDFEKKDIESINEKNVTREIEITNYVKRFPEHEQFFIEIAVTMNPSIMDIEQSIDNFHKRLWNFCEGDKNKSQHQLLFLGSKEMKIEALRYRLKDLRLAIHPDFEMWLEKEEDNTVLFFITLLIHIKAYDRETAFTRSIILHDRKYWDVWHENQKYGRLLNDRFGIKI